MIGCNRNQWEKSKNPNTMFSLPDTLTQSVSEDKEEENRRLFYVAMTRAKTNLNISYAARDNNGKDLERTQFIDESKIIIHKLDEVKIEDYMEDELKLIKITPSLEKDYLDRFFENYRLSISHLNKYLRCPVAFYYENVLKVPFVANEALIYGNAAHIAMKRLYDSRKNGFGLRESEFIEVLINYIDSNGGQLSQDAIKRRKFLGRESLHNYYQKVYPYSNFITLNEYGIKGITINNIPFKGVLDKLEFDGDNVTVVDYKTGNVKNAIKEMRPPSIKNPSGSNYWRQLIAYKLIIDAIYYKPWKWVDSRLDIIDKNETISILLSDNYIPEHDVIVMNQIKEVYDKIMNHEFSEGCEDPKCFWCNFQKNVI